MATQIKIPDFAGGPSPCDQEVVRQSVSDEPPYFENYFTTPYMQQRVAYLLGVNEVTIRHLMLEEFTAVFGVLEHTPSMSREEFLLRVVDRAPESFLIDSDFDTEFQKLISFNHQPLTKKQTSYIATISSITAQFRLENLKVLGHTDFKVLFELAIILVLPPVQRDLYLRRYLCKCAFELRAENESVKTWYINEVPTLISKLAKYIGQRLPIPESVEV